MLPRPIKPTLKELIFYSPEPETDSLPAIPRRAVENNRCSNDRL
jgi:hypothetical protein